MNAYKKELEIIASTMLEQNTIAKGEENKPNYSNRDFMNAVIIFQTALMDKMYDNQDYDEMSFEERMKMSLTCASDLKKLIHTYTNLNIDEYEKFV